MSNISAARQQLLFQHEGADGWITMAKKDPTTHAFNQYHYKIDDLVHNLSEWTGEDIYYSQGTFYKPQRRIDNIRQLRSLYVDMDVYTKNINPEWALAKMEQECFRKTIPEPNMVIFSGRGLVLIWNIDPIPYKAIPLWKAVETYLQQSLKELGSDSKATDPTRIFRLAGSINSKNNAVVTAQYRHNYRYDIHEIQFDYLPELTPKPDSQKKNGRKTKIVRLFNTYTLHLARTKDIATLVELRGGEMSGYRETTCFLYRYFTCCYTDDHEQALDDTLSLNSEFSDPLPERDVISATKSAETAWKAKSDKKANEAAKAMGYPGAGYLLTNAKLIEWLNITTDEQRHMSTIIGSKEKRRRDIKKKEQDRRKKGIRTREEYLSDKQKETERRIKQMKNILQHSTKLSNRKIAKKMGVSESYIRKLRKTLC